MHPVTIDFHQPQPWPTGILSMNFSAASLWEIGVEVSLGKLVLQNDWPATIGNELELNGIRWLPIELAHCAKVATLPFHHRDPFVRLLVAQALHEEMALITADTTLAAPHAMGGLELPAMHVAPEGGN